jgi:tripartite-type tricarboxylate transporter receptor subunit TctC
MAFFLENELKVPCTVINATGGQGVTGHRRGLTSRADGYTVAVITFELNTLHWQGLTDLTWKDAVPLISVNEDAAAIWVRKDSPWQSLADLLRDVKATPGKLRASGTGTGAAWHLALAGWLQKAGLPADAISWIPMGGADPSIQELLSGGIDLVCCSLPEAKLPYGRGDMRSLGVMAEDRVTGFEEIPTLREQGFDWTLVGWRGFAVAPGTPPDRVRKLTAAMKKIVTGELSVDGKTFPAFMAQRGFNNRWREQEEFAAFLKDNDELLGALLTSEAFRNLSEGKVGPYAFPGLLGVLLLGLVVVQFVISVRRAKECVVEETASNLPASAIAKTPSSGLTAAFSPRKGNEHRQILNVALALGAIVFYLLCAETIGFLVASAVILFVLLVRLRTRLLTASLITVVLVPGIYQLFSGLLRVPLPRGWWGW